MQRKWNVQESAGPPRRIGLVPATCLVVASMIGAGAFTTTGLLLRDLGSPLAVLAAWAIGGVVSLCGALAYAELGAALPENGGEYRLLSRIFHPAVGFLAGWISFVVGFSAPLAAVSIAFGRYMAAVVPGTRADVAAIGAIGFFSFLHATRVTIGAAVHGLITVLEVLLILVFATGGVLAGNPARVWDGPGGSFWQALKSPAFAVGLVYVSFSYSGWNAAAYVAGEVDQPGRTLPRALGLGASLVTLLYLMIAAALLMAAPAAELTGVVEVGHAAAVRLFGQGAGRALSAVLALCLFASIGAQLMTSARVYEAMGRDYAALRALSGRGTGSGPVPGLALQAGTAIAMALTASFDGLLTYVGFTLSLTAMLTIFGVFVLRRREPALARPYRTVGYPLTPLVAILISGWTALRTLIERPAASVAGLGTLAVGAVLYEVVRRR